MDQLVQLGVLHLVGNQGVTQHAAIYRQGGVQGVEAGGHLHPLHLIDGVSVSEVHTGLLQGGPSVGEAVLDNQILGTLSVDKGSDVGVLGGNHRGHVLYTQGSQVLANGVGRTGGDLVNH